MAKAFLIQLNSPGPNLFRQSLVDRIEEKIPKCVPIGEREVSLCEMSVSV